MKYAGTDDEQALFATIKRTHGLLLKRLSRRLFFVVNKADIRKVCAGWTIKECCQSVAEHVTAAMGVPGFILKPEQARQLIKSSMLMSPLPNCCCVNSDCLRCEIALTTRHCCRCIVCQDMRLCWDAYS